MSERFATEIRIGGEISAASVPALCEAITSESLSPDWGEAPFEPQTAEELMSNRRLVENAQVLKLCDDQARWGSFPDLEMFLKEHGIAFDRFTEGGCGYDAERESYRPGKNPVTMLTTIEGKPLVPQELVASLIGTLQEMQAAAVHRDCHRVETLARAALHALQTAVPVVPALPPLAILSCQAAA